MEVVLLGYASCILSDSHCKYYVANACLAMSALLIVSVAIPNQNRFWKRPYYFLNFLSIDMYIVAAAAGLFRSRYGRYVLFPYVS